MKAAGRVGARGAYSPRVSTRSSFPGSTVLADRSVLCPVLIGRAAPLETVERALARAREGAGGALVVSGEAGVGKSRLLRALADRARAGGGLLLRGACFAADRALPYAPLLDLVRAFVASSSPAVVAHALGGALPELLAHFPELERLLPVPDDARSAHPSRDPEQAQRRLLHALGIALEALARTQPVVLVLEDVHWS